MAVLFVIHMALSWLMLQASNIFYSEAYWLVCHLCTLLFWALAARLMAGYIECRARAYILILYGV